MNRIRFVVQSVLPLCPLLAITLLAEDAHAQVTEVTVGITPTCPYGLGACWAGAYEALMRIEGVESVSMAPNLYNCTANVRLKDNRLPDPNQWASQFSTFVGQVYLFRGVEVTVQGRLEGDDDSLVLRVPEIEQPITIGPLQHKLQWNAKKGSARQPEPDERDGYQQLLAQKKQTNASDFDVQVTGPLHTADRKIVLEVREFFSASPDPSSRQQD